ncbi:MAG: hypothetical protein B6U97_02070 [Candidatus Altiarchaeales archaeon ex4484_96]|nr:MAG: hypothetical protein B6U97_02070 [Candidatus Altiarchaeales archaeon ex4484_96]
MKNEIMENLQKIREALKADGGDIELVEVDQDTGIVKVRLTGACAGCPFSQMTLKNFVEAHLKKNVKRVERVESV